MRRTWLSVLSPPPLSVWTDWDGELANIDETREAMEIIEASTFLQAISIHGLLLLSRLALRRRPVSSFFSRFSSLLFFPCFISEKIHNSLISEYSEPFVWLYSYIFFFCRKFYFILEYGLKCKSWICTWILCICIHWRSLVQSDWIEFEIFRLLCLCEIFRVTNR